MRYVTILALATLLLLAACSDDPTYSSSGGTGSGADGGMVAANCGNYVLEGSLSLDSQEDVADYPGYSWITGGLYIGEEPEDKGPMPSSIITLMNLSSLRCTQTLDLFNNWQLTDLKGLDKLTRTECLYITSNNLVTLHGLEGLATVEDSLILSGNDLLCDVDNLGGLEHVGHELVISHNDLLASLVGLSNLTLGGGELRIEENESLPTCEAIALRDQLIAAGFDGLVCIRGNLADACEDDTSGCW